MPKSLRCLIYLGVPFALIDSWLMAFIWKGMPLFSIQNLITTLLTTSLFLLLGYFSWCRK